MIIKIASLYSDGAEDRKDLLQEIYYQIWKSFDSFKGNAKKSTWLYRICMNTAIQFLKKKKNFTKHAYTEDLVERITVSNTYEESVVNLSKLLQPLNELDKGIVLLYLEEKSHKEIAEIIGISISNVGTRFNRIKEKLKKLNKSSKI